MKNRYIIILLTILGLTSCNSNVLPEKPEKLYEKYRSAVVLIKHQYYYEAELGSGLKIYLSQIDNINRENIYFDEKDILANSKTIYGTGFFVSKDGLIATNKHVAYPIENEGQIFSQLQLVLDEIKFNCEAKDRLFQDSINRISNHIIENTNWLTAESISFLNSLIDNWNLQRREIAVLLALLNSGTTQGQVRCKTIFLGIIQENTFVNRESDYKECFLVKKSDNNEIDLALIQTKDKTLPSSVKTIFDFANHNPNVAKSNVDSSSNKIRIDTKVYMIGYNNGIDLARTSEGIKAQLTQGSVSQESDTYRILYSIPSLSGSSGSPVIDEWGNLVAINYAKVNNSQSFNYGIPAKYLKDLINEMR